jgi:hypothetical protein
MNALPLFPLFVLGLLGAAGLYAYAAARAARQRETALVEHAAALDPRALAGLHDHLLRSALDLYGERELAPGRARIECVVVLRDRIDALCGRTSGALNRSRWRGRLLPGAHRLRGWPPPQRVRAYLDLNLLDAAAPVPADVESEARRMLAVGWPTGG